MRKALISLLIALPLVAASADLKFKESFADPATREAALQTLLPQTRDWFFYHALHQQLGGRTAEFRATMDAWKAAITREENPVENEGFETLEKRELLLRYEANPGETVESLVKMLDLKFEDTRPDARAAENLPTLLNPAWIAPSAFEKAASDRQADGYSYREYSPERLLAELERLEEFDDEKLRYFRKTLRRADHPAAVPLLIKALSLPAAPQFGDQPIDTLLVREQLDALLAARPELRGSESFAIRYLVTLLPGEETDFSRDRAAHAAHLAACREFLRESPAALNSLKGHVLFHHLRLQREMGVFPLADLLDYLRLPRAEHSILRTTKRGEGAVYLDTGEDFRSATHCPPVNDDSALVDALLRHFLGRSETPDAFRAVVEERALRTIHARARLLAGEDPVRWGSELPPGMLAELQDETRIDFAPGQPVTLASDATVALTLDLKHTPDLLVRIYELDLPSWLESHGAEPPVDLDLDGLVPHHEKRFTFTQPPLVMHRETLPLPELTGAGAWIVEAVSRGASSRMLVRKGALVPYVEQTARGFSVRVIRETGTLAKDATITLGRRTLTGGEDGRIFIPDDALVLGERCLVRHGRLAAVVDLPDSEEPVVLEARFHLEREQLLADHEARLLLRPRLSRRGHELPLDGLENPVLTMTATLNGGMTVERVLSRDLKLAPLTLVPFQVPADTVSLDFSLSGKNTPREGEDPVTLTAATRYELNSALASSRIGSAHFTRDLGGYRVELRGRNGEPLASRPVNFEFVHRDFSTRVRLALRSDAEGTISLGRLDGITGVHMRGTEIGDFHHGLGDEDGSFALPARLLVSVDEEIRLPLGRFMQDPDHRRLSLLEMRDGVVLRDHFKKLAVIDRRLVVRGLPPGEHVLMVDGHTVRISVSPSPGQEGLLISPARVMPRHLPSLPSVTAATREADLLVVRVDGADARTRVSVIGSRFLHGWKAGSGLIPFADPMPDVLSPGFEGIGFLTERRLSDEMRYILERRAATTFPGSMLPRPGLLVNRWSSQDVDQTTTGGLGGSDGRGSRDSARGSNLPTRPKQALPPSGGDREGPLIDFLAEPSVIRHDLEVDANGQVVLPAADFEGCQVLEILAATPDGHHRRVVPLEKSPTPLRDRRLLSPLDPATHLIGTRRTAVIAKDAEAVIETVTDADWRAFTTLAEAHAFLLGATGSTRLAEFQPLLEWPSLDEARKLAFYSDHACHELHLFLARKDPDFFARHVKPMLAEKREPTVIDDILLGRDVSGYLRPFAWQRLNAAEKALLAQAMPEMRGRISSELSNRWELEAPGPEAETTLFTQTLRGEHLGVDLAMASGLPEPPSGDHEGSSSMSSQGHKRILAKLENIVIPLMDFEDTSVEEAVDFLRVRAAELDSLELDASRRGVNFVIRRPRADADDSPLGAARDPRSLRIDQLTLRNVPLSEALRYICEKTKLRYKVDDFAVTLLPATETSEDLISRTFTVPPDFIRLTDVGASDDPFAGSGRTALRSRNSVEEILKDNGVSEVEGSFATLTNSRLVVRNTPTNVDIIEQLVEAASGEMSAGLDPGSSRRFAEADPFASSDPFADAFAGTALRARPAWSSDRDQTRLWAESNYDKHRGRTDESFIPLNRFWIDLAAWDGKGPFLSPHFNACTGGPNEALFCLAMLDLPFTAGRPETRVDGATLRVKAREPMLLFYKDTRPTDRIAEESPVLVRQTFHRLDDRFRTEDGRKIENLHTGDFVAGVPYGASLVVTNPDGAGRRIDVLAQIPEEAIPLEGEPVTLSTTHELEPYGVLSLRLAFYFPAAGDFPIYPLQVAEQEQVLGRTAPRRLRVVAEAPPADSASWPVIARDGSAAVVLERLRTANLGTLDMRLIRWRMRDADFFRQAETILRERFAFQADMAAFGFLHGSVPAMRDYLEVSRMSGELGEWLDSPLLAIRPVTHRAWETLEFDPLVNPRSHPFADRPRLTHGEAARHVESFLDVLSWKPAPDDADQLTWTAHLLLQDRIEEALARFDRIDPAKLPARLAYDYMHAVVLFHRGQPEEARAIAKRHGTLPPGLWKSRFDAVTAQADEIRALKTPRGEKAAPPEQEAPALDLALAPDGTLSLTHRKLKEVELQLFSVDLEVLFSKDPFLSGDAAALPGIRANDTQTLPLEGERTTVNLPEAFRRGNVLVSAKADQAQVLRVLDSRALEMVRQPAEKTLQVFDAATRLPLSRCYVKVYLQKDGGDPVFHKDGYTDLRGKFDYLAHTGGQAEGARRIAVMISHPDKGARIETFSP